MDQTTMSKSAFARHIGVTPARITQYINEGTIDKSALVGEGRAAKINVAIATQLIAERRDPTQVAANGTADLASGDDLFPYPGEPSRNHIPSQSQPVSAPRNALDIELKREKLLREQRANLRAARQDAVEDGRLVPSVELSAEVSKAVTRTMQVYEGAVPEIARRFSAQFDVPQRDAEHLIRKVINDVRGREAQKEAARANGLADTKEVVLTDETIQ